MSFTEYPEKDIAAHRSMARENSIIAFILIIGSTVFVSIAVSRIGTVTYEIATAGAVLVGGILLMWVSELSWKLQALHWEVEERTRTVASVHRYGRLGHPPRTARTLIDSFKELVGWKDETD